MCESRSSGRLLRWSAAIRFCATTRLRARSASAAVVAPETEPGAGAQTYVSLLLPALAGRLDVTVAAHGPGPVVAAARSAGFHFVPLRHVRRALHPWHDLLGLVELFRLCRRVRPDIVHANSSKAGVLGRVAAFLARVPIRIFTVHGWAFAAHRGLAGRLFLWAERL